MSTGRQPLPLTRVSMLVGHHLGVSVNVIIDSRDLIADKFVRCCAVM